MTWTKHHCGEETNYVFPKKEAAGKRYYSSTPEELMIKAVILSDSGMYFCKPTTVGLQNGTAVGYLNVTKEDRNSLPFNTMVIMVGGSALFLILLYTFVLTCVCWYRRGVRREEEVVQVEEVVEERLYSEIPDICGED
ncbi:unnamed protein product [Merluccius merluccius]